MSKQKKISSLFLIILASIMLFIAWPATADEDGHLVEGFNPFSGDGILTFTSAKIVAVDENGKTVGLRYVDGEMILSRHNPDGSLDDTFCGDGNCVVTPPIDFTAQALGIQSGERILIGGNSLGDQAVLRLQADGTLDPNFEITTQSIGDEGVFVNIIFVDEDNRFYMAGTSVDCPVWPLPCGSGDVEQFATARYHMDGGIDTSFHNDGVVTVDFGGWNQMPEKILKMADGRLLLVGSQADGDGGPTMYAAARLLPNGNKDLTFDNDGEQAGFGIGQGHDAVLQPDGKLIISGKDGSRTDDNIGLVRLDGDGAVDSSFGDNGILRPQTPFGFLDGNINMTYLPNGNLLVIGLNDQDITDRAIIAASYTADWQLDPNFGAGVGAVRIDLPDELNTQQIVDVSLNNDGRILISTGIHDIAHNIVVRIFANGQLDTGGWVTQDITNLDDTINDMVIQPDGKIVATGAVLDNGMGLAVYHDDGALDTSFGFGKGYLTNPTPRSYGLALAVDAASRKIVLRGYAEDDNAPINYKLPRYSPTGSLTLWPNGVPINGPIGQWGGDSNFATDIVMHPDESFVVVGNTDGVIALTQYRNSGALDLPYGGGGTGTSRAHVYAGYAFANGAVRQDDGKIVVVGHVADKAFIMRLKTDGGYDEDFNGNGLRVIDIPNSATEYLEDVVVLPNGQIVAVGSMTGFDNNDMVVMFFNPDGSFNDTHYGDGVLQMPLGNDASLHAAVVDEDGSVMAAGCAKGAADKFAAVRIKPDGQLEGDFGDNGILTLHETPTHGKACAHAIDLDETTGEFVLAGFSETRNGDQQFALVRIKRGVPLSDATAVAPNVSITTNSNDIQLSWNHLAANDEYEVWRSSVPYFTPGDSGSTSIVTIDAPTAPTPMTYTDTGAAVDANQYFYIVKAIVGASEALSNQTGKLTYPVTAGN